MEYAKAWLILTEIGVKKQTCAKPSNEDCVMGYESVPSHTKLESSQLAGHETISAQLLLVLIRVHHLGNTRRNRSFVE